jgi:P2-related tail formation protein
MSDAAGVGSSLSAASSINDTRTQALLALIQRLGNIDLSPILVYTLQNVPVSALPFLAWQFDILAPWWQLLSGPDSQQQLIQQAVDLHRYKGTPYAIQAIMSGLGFELPTIQEGQASWGGTSWPDTQGWAVFRIVVPKADIALADPQPASWDAVSSVDLLLDVNNILQATSITGAAVTTDTETQAIAAIEFFAPARSWLDSLWFKELPIHDSVAPSDEISIVAANYIGEKAFQITEFIAVQGWALADAKTTVPFYSAHFYHAGLTYGTTEPAVVDSSIVINGTPTE